MNIMLTHSNTAATHCRDTALQIPERVHLCNSSSTKHNIKNCGMYLTYAVSHKSVIVIYVN